LGCLVLLTCGCAEPKGVSSTSPGLSTDARRAPCIAILKFKNLKRDEASDWLAAGAAETLTTKLAGVPALRVVDQANVQEALDQQAFAGLDLAEPNNAVKVGKILAADRMVVGTYAAEAASILFNVRVVDVTTVEVLSAASVTGGREQIFDTLYKLADAVVASFDKVAVMVDARPVVRDAPPEQRIALNAEERKAMQEAGATSAAAYESFSKGLQAGGHDERVRLFSAALGADPRYLPAYVRRGLAHLQKGDYAKAIADFDQAIRLNATDPRLYNLRAVAHLRKGEPDAAIEDAGRAIRLRPNFAEAYRTRAAAFAQKGQYEQAWADVRRCRQLGGVVPPRLIAQLRRAGGGRPRPRPLRRRGPP
jgi:tetratricopeptide (TPR) repeat protein